MNEYSELDVHSINVTAHARSRWEQRGYLGNYGLLYELRKSKELNDDSAEYEEDLLNFWRVEAMFRHYRDGRRYYYTSCFIFVIGSQNLITCIARSPLSKKKRIGLSRQKRQRHR